MEKSCLQVEISTQVNIVNSVSLLLDKKILVHLCR
jgi:hypothetical protein